MSGNVKSARFTTMFWVTPAISVLGGVVFLVCAGLGGHPALGVVLFGIMVVFAALLVVAGRYSETVRGLLDHRDERLASIDLRATATSGVAVILAVLCAGAVELARGHSGAPYTWLAAIAGVAYLLTAAVRR